MTDVEPGNEPQIVEFLRWALSEEAPVELIGNGSKRRLGSPVQAAHTLSTRAMTGITLYEPEELVLRALPGTTIAEIETALAAQNQMLAFEPPDWGPLFGMPAKTGTLGGAIGCNLTGPRRVRFGAARDHILGFRAVNGRGESFKSGGRVMKNVTGYDLPKLMAGSMGTLAAMTEITLKVLPRAEKMRTVLLYGLDAEAANAALVRALQMPFEVTGAAFLPANIASASGVDLVRGAGASVTAIRLEGAPESTSDRCTRLRALMREATNALDEELHGTRSAAFWTEIADVAPLLPDPAATILRLSVPPASGARALLRTKALCGCKGYLDWGGGAVWLAGLNGAALATAAQAAIAETGGVVQPIRNAAPGMMLAGLVAPDELARAIKAAFDPKFILNPGRMG
ncbi:MAG: FAD-binding protein [Rhodospirillaceae bacterium]|nr:FAD-binding protein [Rhodospirillaceae bacterium]